MERWPLATAPFRLGAGLRRLHVGRLRVGLLGLALAGALATPVAAEDFTGFYAGVNAGYGWSKERSTSGVKPGSPLPGWGQPPQADGLPPSAARAADRNPGFSGSKGGTR